MGGFFPTEGADTDGQMRNCAGSMAKKKFVECFVCVCFPPPILKGGLAGIRIQLAFGYST